MPPPYPPNPTWLVHSAVISAWGWWSLGTAMHVLAFLMICLHCLKMRREATSALLWMFIAWSFPLVGPILYLCFGIYRVPDRGWRKHQRNQEFLAHRQAWEEETLPLAYWRAVHESRVAEPEDPFAHDLNHAMDTILDEYPLLGGNEVRLLINGTEAYPAMFDAIAAARHHIHFQTFMICNDEVGRAFLEALAAKASAGVRVRLLYDRFGSTHAVLTGLLRRYRSVPNFELVGWTQANLIKRQFQVNLRNHRKIMVVDGRAAFAGGINVHRENTDTEKGPAIRDYHFALRGPIVQELQYSFLRDWYFMTDADPEALLHADHFPEVPPVGRALVRLINSGPTSELETIEDVFFTCVTSAQRQILAVTPYFVPTPDILRAFRTAALRGVDVRLTVPRVNNHVYAGLAGRALYGDLLAAGVRVFERNPPFMHAKALVVDDVLALVGTANIDVRSLRLNYETNLAVYDAGLVTALKRAILDEIACSVELDYGTWSTRPLRRRLIENFCALMTPIL
ncbi:MAG: cardiolipin synthase [Kiritimatiellaeota bacterium]|nr:cardiolipin synthase [Kiritimatiellota bacterium]